MKKNTKILIAVVLIVALVASLTAIYLATRPKTAQGSKSFTVEVVHADGNKKTFSYQTDAEYLGEALLDEGLIAGDVSEFGLYINTVDGEDANYEENNSYWALYVGEEYAQQGIDQTPVSDGGQYSLVYTVG